MVKIGHEGRGANIKEIEFLWSMAHSIRFIVPAEGVANLVLVCNKHDACILGYALLINHFKNAALHFILSETGASVNLTIINTDTGEYVSLNSLGFLKSQLNFFKNKIASETTVGISLAQSVNSRITQIETDPILGILSYEMAQYTLP